MENRSLLLTIVSGSFTSMGNRFAHVVFSNVMSSYRAEFSCSETLKKTSKCNATHLLT